MFSCAETEPNTTLNCPETLLPKSEDFGFVGMDVTTTGNETATPEFDDAFDELLSVKCVKIGVKQKRDEIDECLICSAWVSKMRDPLANKQKMEKDSPLKQFISSYFRTLQTRKCF